MMSTDAVLFVVGVLIGVLVGTLASALGGFWLRRWEWRQERRFNLREMCYEVLAMIPRDAGSSDLWERAPHADVRDLCKKIARLATITGRSEHQHADAVFGPFLLWEVAEEFGRRPDQQWWIDLRAALIDLLDYTGRQLYGSRRQLRSRRFFRRRWRWASDGSIIVEEPTRRDLAVRVRARPVRDSADSAEAQPAG